MPRRDDIGKILIIGSGPIIIGQACEFDYSGTQACKALKKLGYEIVLVNSNPATIMTDPAMADVTYIEPLNVASLTEIIAKERPDALLPNLGGQTGLNLSSALAREGVLEKYGVQVIGGTNVQFAHDPKTGRVVVIEINPRTSRSSALASKATGFPIAFVSSLLACGLTLDEIPYWRDGTLEKYTPSGEYVVVKFARWAFEKFKGVQDRLGTQMRAVGARS